MNFMIGASFLMLMVLIYRSMHGGKGGNLGQKSSKGSGGS